MEKSSSSPSLTGLDGSSPELLTCVSKLEIVTPKPPGVFLCGSIPVPTDKAFHAFNSALVPSRQIATAPRYRMLPKATDLNALPLLPNFSEKVLPNWAVQSKVAGDFPWDDGAVASNLTRKSEALALLGLVDYGDEIDVIAPTDVLKQIFKMPYSKARLSIAVHRIGQTLVLNAGPGVEEGEKLVRRHKNQSKCADQSLFLNFAMHSVRMEACDCPTTHRPPSQEQSFSSVLPEISTPKLADRTNLVAPELDHGSEYTQSEKDALFWKGKKSKKSMRHDPIKKVSEVGEKPRGSMEESEKHRRVGDDGFLRVLFWQFHNFRMLLGSDLLLFSNEKYVSVSLHLWDITRQVTPLNWLEAWLDNFMGSVPELAICYHENGVIQGYELLKTDDIFLLKGLSEDGTPAFHPYVVQQNGLSVLRFLQENCKQDPGAYWLYKSAGEDVIQLFDLSLIPKNESSCDNDDNSSSFPSALFGGKNDFLFSLGSLLFRIAHRLAVSMVPAKRAKCMGYFKKCLDFFDEPNHLFVRASAHEQFARLILNFEDEVDFTLDSLPMGCEVVVTDAEEDSVDVFSVTDSGPYDDASVIREIQPREDDQCFQNSSTEDFASGGSELEVERTGNVCLFETQETEYETLPDHGGVVNANPDRDFAVCKVSPTPFHVQTVSDPISPKLAAIHHVSQAIKSLRLMRQLRSAEPETDPSCRTYDRLPSSFSLSACACGDTDCIEVCDLRSWLQTTNLDHKLWKLVLLLGESYLALGQAYKEDGQLCQTLKVVELACSVYGSMPQHLDDTKFISSMISYNIGEVPLNEDKRIRPYNDSYNNFSSGYDDDDISTLQQYSLKYLFWANAWTLVGDVYVDLHLTKDKQISTEAEGKSSMRELRMSSDVAKEVNRLKKKLGKSKQNCSSCSLVNCSCQSDRANSGSSASCSSGERTTATNNRKYSKNSHCKRTPKTHSGDLKDDHVRPKNANRKGLITGNSEKNSDRQIPKGAVSTGNLGVKPSAATSDESGVNGMENHEMGPISGGTPKVKNGGIFKYLGNPVGGPAECSLDAALKCYEEARRALGELPANSSELQSVTRKKGWVCNELGRWRLERKELNEAEEAFSNAIDAFREVSDHTNIILIGCNLGHGRRSLAEEMTLKVEDLRKHTTFQNAYSHALEKAKLEYCKSLRYYGAAKSDLSAAAEDPAIVSGGLKNEVYTQLAHTYLRLGMLLAKEDTTAEVYDQGAMDDIYAVYSTSSVRKSRKEPRKHEISANDAIREALSLYESLGELRKQEAAYAYFQLACYQRDCCLKFLESDCKKNIISRGDDDLQRVRRYASLAERNWQKAMEFYGSKTHPTMYLTVLIERSSLSLSLSNSLHSNTMLEVAFSIMLEGRHLSVSAPDSFKIQEAEIHSKFWSHLQMVLKKMVLTSLSAKPSKPSSATPPTTTPSSRSGEAEKLKLLYKMSLKFCEFSQLHHMHELWISQSKPSLPPSICSEFS